MFVLSTTLALQAAPEKAKEIPSMAEDELREVELPKSVFVLPANPDEGRDPFFPNSTRPYATSTPAAPARPAAAPVSLVLKGFSGPVDRRLAIINNRTFEAGEEGDVVFPGGRIKVRCVEIRDESVVIEMGGERRELRLRRGV